jgi:hypothetical protein
MPPNIPMELFTHINKKATTNTDKSILNTKKMVTVESAGIQENQNACKIQQNKT